MTTDIPGQITQAVTYITTQIQAERKAEIMTRAATVKPNTSLMVRFRTATGAAPTITRLNADQFRTLLERRPAAFTGR